VVNLLDNFYAQWRVRRGVVPALRDDQDSPPERLVQAIWQHQRLQRDHLKTLDGQPVKVLHPGFHNLEGGPDFRAAVIQVGDVAAQSGDVEVDLRSNGWHAHGHSRMSFCMRFGRARNRRWEDRRYCCCDLSWMRRWEN
jgi:hypothetical protein